MTCPPPPAPTERPQPDEPKATWRIWARSVPGRATLPRGAIDELAGPSGWVVTWRPLSDEPAPHPVEIGLEPRLALTRTPDSGGLTVHPADSPTEQHPYGFEQPAGGSPVVPLDDIAVVLVPGLAFDHAGIRLGRGAGYFDRFLADLADTVHLVGVCAQARVVDLLPREPHDIPMTHLLTEKGVNPTKSV
ncbi:MAG: 5-formyltetrahydrofolate cyclo-ligase [Actinomycetia bacterium]|nr:5-formyltetrahydrofolate cyclo-ligase [Actinomycetes bacterium]MCP4086017.1 5-formyltetrahydrofolate cyclo-ligase [Actinomycetes bacterium]